MKKLFLILALLLSSPAWAATTPSTGFFIRTNCASITTPGTNSVACLQTTTTGGRSAGGLYVWNGSAWALISGGGGTGTPGGANTEVQFNDSGVFNGDNGLTFNKTTNVLTAAGGFVGTITGALIGNVTGNVTGSLSGNVTGNATTATALGADPTNCAAGQAPLGVAANGDVQGCWTPGDVTEVQGTTNEITVTSGTGPIPVVGLSTTFDISGKTSTKPVKSGTTAPATCGVGEMFFDTDATVGLNLFGCTSTNTWTLLGDGAGAGAGDINQVGDCASGDCLSVTGSGTSLTFRNATSGTVTLQTVAGALGSPVVSLPATTGTVALVAGNVATATALAANGTNCSAGQFAAGVDASGVAEGCTALPTTITGTANQITASASTGAITLSIPTSPTLPGTTTGTFSGNLTGNATTATALAANPTNCSAGSAPEGVAASGAVENCTAYVPLNGATAMTGQLVTSNLGVEFTESDTNPTCAAGNYTIYADTSEGKLKKCQNGVGTDLDASGAGTVSTTGSMTATAIVTSNTTGGTVIQTPSATTTLDSSGNLSTPGTIAIGVGGANGGGFDLVQGTAVTPTANSVRWQAPTSVPTAYTQLLPSAGATGFLYNTFSGAVGSMSYVGVSGTGNVCLTTSCVMVTPTLGAATATSINGMSLTGSNTAFTIATNLNFTVNNSLTLAGTNGTTMTFPTTNATIARSDAANTFAGTQSFGAQIVTSNLGIEFAESDTNPTCAAGNYTVYADLSETKLKKCQNGTLTDLDASGAGTVTNIATTSPISGGTITATGTLSCPTCVTSAAALTSGQLVAGAGSQASAVTNLTGDVTTSGGVATTIAAAAVTAAKTAADLKVRPCEVTWGSKVAAATAIANDDDVPFVCSNLTGSTLTITSVECLADSADVTMDVVISGGATILTGSVTCGNGSFSAATLSGTPTQSNNGSLNANITSGGTGKYAVLRIKRTL